MNFCKLTFFLFILSINSSDAVCTTVDSTFNVIGTKGQSCSDACTACGGSDNTAANIGNLDTASKILTFMNSVCTGPNWNTFATTSASSYIHHYPCNYGGSLNIFYVGPGTTYAAGSDSRLYNFCSCSATTNCNTNCQCSDIEQTGTSPSPPTKAPTNDDSSDLSDAKIGAIAAGSGLFLVSAIGGAVYYFSSSSTATATATATESISSTVDNGESDKKQTIIDLSDTKTPGV